MPAVLAAQQLPDRSQPPALGPPARLDVAAIEKHELTNGLDVWLVETHEVPLVQVNLVVHAGSGDDPAGEFGLASLTAAMLDEGAGARSALEIADAVEFLGAELGTTSSFDASAVRLNVPARALERALPIMADVALEADVPGRRARAPAQERLTALLQARDDPAAVAARRVPARRLRRRASLRHERRRHDGDARRRSRRGSCAAFHAAKYRPSNATLIVVGDVTAAAVLPLLESAFGGWTGATRRGASRRCPRRRGRARGKSTIVDMPGAEQSQIRIGTVGVARSTPDYFALQVLNTVLGGSFTSRLNQNLREEHGYAYGASSRFDMRLAPGPFVAAAGVQTDKTAESLTEFFNELDAIREADRRGRAREGQELSGAGFPGDVRDDRRSCGAPRGARDLWAAGPFYADYTTQHRRRHGRGRCSAPRRRIIEPDKLAVVVVGDRARIEPGIRAFDSRPRARVRPWTTSCLTLRRSS